MRQNFMFSQKISSKEDETKKQLHGICSMSKSIKEKITCWDLESNPKVQIPTSLFTCSVILAGFKIFLSPEIHL